MIVNSYFFNMFLLKNSFKPNILTNLAKLHFDKTEKEALKEDLQNMLNFINQVNVVDTEGVEPLIHINTRYNNFREDVAKHLNTKAEILSNAPAKNDDFFLVPKVIKK